MVIAKEKEKSKINVSKIVMIILIAVIALVVGAAVFLAFRTYSRAKDALRDAKNIVLALYTTDIEKYGSGGCVYDATARDGLSDGVEESVERLMDPKGTYAITSYSYKKHEVTGLSYRWDNYLVTYVKNGDSVTWDVDYLFNVYNYTSEDVIVK